MIFDIDTIVSYCSQFITLRPGCLIITGTPAGVGFGMKPQTYLAQGDIIEMSITGLVHATSFGARRLICRCFAQCMDNEESYAYV